MQTRSSNESARVHRGLGSAVAWPVVARAQQGRKVFRVALLNAGAALPSELSSVLPDALRELGWIDGKNITIETALAENNIAQLRELTENLVRRNVDLIVTVGTLAPLAAKHATTTIPIVMTSAGDPLGSGLVASLAHPGGNVTGLSLMAPDLGGKRLQILKELLPSISRVAVLWNASNPYPGLVFRETRDAGANLDVQIQSLEVRGPSDFDDALQAAIREHANALITVEDPLTADYQKQIADFAINSRLPTMHGLKLFVVAGGLMSYGADVADLVRRSAGYVDKILKGANPADLPVEQPTKFDFLINLKTAKTLGIEVPPSLLARADEVIE